MNSWSKMLVILLSLGAGTTQAIDYDKEAKIVFKRVLDQHADSFVRVSFVMGSTYMGQEQRQESSTTGVLVDTRGLVLVPRMVVEPTLPNSGKLTAEQRASFKLESRDFRIHFPGEDQPLEAEALTSDPDQSVAWLRIKDLGERKLHIVDLSQTEVPEAGQSYYVIERLEERFGEKPIISWGIVQGEVELPQQAHVVNGALGLAISGSGKVLGYVSANFEGAVSDAFSMTGGIRMLMTPAKRLNSANLRATSLLDSSGAEP